MGFTWSWFTAQTVLQRQRLSTLGGTGTLLSGHRWVALLAGYALFGEPTDNAAVLETDHAVGLDNEQLEALW